MNGIEKITARIMADAQTEAEAIRKASEESCAAARADNEKAARQKYDSLTQDGAKETEQRVQRMERTAKLEAKKSILAAKQQAVSEAFELAKSKINGLPEADYVGFLARQAAAAAITGQEEIIFSQDDRHSVGAKVTKLTNELLARNGKSAAVTLSEETRPMSGGLILKQGDIEVNCSVDTLLEFSRGELASQVAEVLFGD